jgi:hypothetical protein
VNFSSLLLAFECPNCGAKKLRAEMKWNDGVPVYRCDTCHCRFRVIRSASHFAALGLAVAVILGVPAFFVGYLTGTGKVETAYAFVAFAAVIVGFLTTIWPPLVRAYVARFVEFERM